MKVENNFKKNKNKEVIHVGLFISIPLILLLILSIFTKNQNDQIKEQNNVQKLASETTQVTPKIDVEIFGKSAFVKRINTGEILFTKNEKEPLPLASITKVMTALFAFVNIQENSQISITDFDLMQDGEYGLFTGESFQKEKLIDFAMVSSSNDAASALISHIANINNKNRTEIISQMNEYGKKIGMKNTTFRNETGLDINEYRASSTGSAEDIATLFEYTIKNYPQVLESTREKSISISSNQGKVYKLENTNDIVGKLTGLLGSKTGYTDIAGGNLAVVVDVGFNDPYIIVVLGSTQKMRFDDVEKIYQQIINN